MTRSVIQTSDAPAAIGPYSQAVKLGSMVFCSGQIGLDPTSGDLVAGGFEAQVEQAIKNLAEVAKASGGTLDHAIKLTLFLTDLSNFGLVNEAMKRSFKAPYPARSTVGVASLPKGAAFEIEAVLVI
jgi:2-iminobutanoate/2-iminopropanoate deaminase